VNIYLNAHIGFFSTVIKLLLCLLQLQGKLNSVSVYSQFLTQMKGNGTPFHIFKSGEFEAVSTGHTDCFGEFFSVIY